MNATIDGLVLTRSIVLVGLMGSGKSSIGKSLAEHLAIKFVDSDDKIEKAAGLSIRNIFEIHGELHFRAYERQIIADLLNEEHPIVLATGGGAYMDIETRRNIRDRCISIWLKSELEVLLKRVSKRRSRPLLNTGNKKETLRNLMETRYPIYEEADITVLSTDVPKKETVAQAINALEKFLKLNSNYHQSDK
mgnify:CR=1 FL=1|tara:strand:+ start:32 stop:607 length:576 start_codon:yes stop_codon:yes gene_type:complete